MIPKHGGHQFLGYFLDPELLGSDHGRPTIMVTTIWKACIEDLTQVAKRHADVLAALKGDPAEYSAQVDRICRGSLHVAKFLGVAIAELSKNKKLHQDIKNTNVLIDDDKQFKLSDFGEAVEVDLEEDFQDGGRGKAKTPAEAIETLTTRLSYYTGSDLYPPRRLRADPAMDIENLCKRDYYAAGVTIWSYISGNQLTRDDFQEQYTAKDVVHDHLKNVFSPLEDRPAARLRVLAALIFNLITLKLGEDTFQKAVDLAQQAFDCADAGSYEQVAKLCSDIDALGKMPETGAISGGCEATKKMATTAGMATILERDDEYGEEENVDIDGLVAGTVVASGTWPTPTLSVAVVLAMAVFLALAITADWSGTKEFVISVWSAIDEAKRRLFDNADDNHADL
jgi:hypothetical protein